MMLIRPILNSHYLKNGKSAVYSALYFIPILALLHTVVGGLICMFYSSIHANEKQIEISYFILDYAFPYLSVIISMVSNAAHFSLKLDQSMKSLFKTSITEMKNAIIISMWKYFKYYLRLLI